MKPSLLRLLVLWVVLAGPALFAQTLNFNLSSATGSLIAFNGSNDTIAFTTGVSGFNFGITNSGGSLLSLNGL